MRSLLPPHRPGLILAPMQDVTDLPFLRLMARYGGPDVFVTEYFRVHPDSRLEPDILRSVTDHGTGRPVVAQMIGEDIPSLVRTVRELEQHPVAGIDLNLGCPAPVVCRKDAGGGLLRHPDRIDRILGALRDAISGRFTVKCRLGFESAEEFESLLRIFRRHAIDGLTVHARTVKDGYRTAVKPAGVASAVASMPCAVIANGNVVDVPTGLALLAQTGAAGLMIGRGAIRNPWLFAQLRAHWEGTVAPQPTGRDVLTWITSLYEDTAAFERRYAPSKHVAKMKKYLCYISQGPDPEGRFEFLIRRVTQPEEFFAVCREFLDHPHPVPAAPPVSSALFSGFSELLKSA
jgi:tRNA-dihydrouridine synthase